METQTLVSSHTTLEYVLGSLVTILSVAGGALGWLLKRKQSYAETDNTRAETAKTKAETRRIETETAKDSAELMVGLIKEVASQTLRAQRLNDEREHWERKACEWEARYIALEGQLNKKLSVNQLPPFEGD